MKKSQRRLERWFRAGLWGVALLFAVFLIGLGSKIVADLPGMDAPPTLEQFLSAKAAPLKNRLKQLEAAKHEHQQAYQQKKLSLQKAKDRVTSERRNFHDWLAARNVTRDDTQNPQVLKRTRQLDALQQAVTERQQAVTHERRQVLNLLQKIEPLERQLDTYQTQARQDLQQARHHYFIVAFGWRLLIVLPLLIIAIWLFKRHRHGNQWPFVWGFAGFAVFAFFVELVPYLPDFGGYIRYGIGIIFTALGGHWGIKALNRYLARQKEAEVMPEETRRQGIDYDTALLHLSKSTCPGCDRKVNLEDDWLNFCPHCGLGLFEHCHQCNARKDAFSPYCRFCGSHSHAS